MKTIIGNWKMNVGIRESVALARGTLLTLRGKKMIPEVVVCPPFIALSEVKKVIAHSSVALGAQNMFWEDSGSYTGEIGTRMLSELGVTYVIVGHSERRIHVGETNAMVNKKVVHALESQLVPILCVGEIAEQRTKGIQQDSVRDELSNALSGVRLRNAENLVIAYEPVWAIGSGNTPEVSDVISMHEFIRSVVSELLPNIKISSLRILYGGSVNGENAYKFLREQKIDGLLVGGASVKLNQFKDIISAASETLEAVSNV